VLEHTAPRRHADVYAASIGDMGAQFLYGDSGAVVPQRRDQGIGGDALRHAVMASALLDTGETDAEGVRKRALRAEPALAHLKNLLP
jgi:hypothetical protein